MSISDAFEKELLKPLKNEAVTIKQADYYCKLHKAEDPGESGATEPATETKRAKVEFEGENPLKNKAAIEWKAVSTTETYKGISIWTKEGIAEGTCVWTGKLTAAKSVEEGDTFLIAKEALTISLD